MTIYLLTIFYFHENNLHNFKYNKYSQNGEDGIINEIFSRLGQENFNDFWLSSLVLGMEST